MQANQLPILLGEQLSSPLTHSGTPIELNSAELILLLAEGEIELFLIPKKDGKDKGRLHLHTLSAASCVLAHGLPSSEIPDFTLIAVPQPGAVYYKQDSAQLRGLAAADKATNEFLSHQSRKFFSVLTGKEATLPPPPAAWSPEELRRQFTTEIDRHFKMLTDTGIRTQQDQIKAAKNNAAQALNKGVHKLAGLFSEKKEHQVESSGDILWDACFLLFKHLGIWVERRVEWEEDFSPERLDRICPVLNIRKREVILEPGWHTEAGMPFLAWKEKEQTPVVVFPDEEGEGAWFLYDPTNKSKTAVTKAVADTLSLKAVVFYTPFPEGKVTPAVLLKTIWKICRKDLKLLVILLIVSSLLGSMIPVFNGIIFSAVIPMSDYDLLWQVFILAVSFALAQCVIEYLIHNLFLRLRTQAEWKLQSALWDRLLSLPVRFFRDYTVGDLSWRSQGIIQLSRMFSTSALRGLLGVIVSLPALFMMFYFSISMSIVMLALLFLIVVVLVIVAKLNLNLQKKIMAVGGELYGEVVQLLSGIGKIRATGTENHAFNTWSRIFTKKRELNYKSEHQGKYATLLTTLFSAMSILVLMSMVTFNIIGDANAPITSAQFISFSSALAIVSTGIGKTTSSTIGMISCVPIYRRMKPILEETCETSSGLIIPKKITGDLSVHHVTFSYDPQQRPILNDLSLDVTAGEFVAIVGESGSGKSTLLRLLMGFEQPSRGSITYDGMDLSKLDLREFRRKIGVVLQNGKLLPDTIYRNIIVGCSNISIEDAWDAAKKAGCYEDIKAMPMQMHTLLNPNGSGVSGGQKQRILIARALVKKPALLFFDEATSALDNKSQYLVTESLKNMNITRIVVAHRLSTIQDADRILFMEGGRIIEEGNYEQLMALNGKFANQAKRQLINA